jgi:eukaryotic translation initiation factor 2C
MKDVLDFATMRPDARLKTIRGGIGVFNYQQSPYLDAFGMKVDEQQTTTDARVLQPPTLRYGPGSKQPTIVSTSILDLLFTRDAHSHPLRFRGMVLGT